MSGDPSPNDGEQDGTDVHTYELDEDERPSEAVIRTVAAVTDRPPTELEPLIERIDPDALDALFGAGSGRGPRPTGTIRFTFGGCEVRVRPDTVVVRDVSECDDAERNEANRG